MVVYHNGEIIADVADISLFKSHGYYVWDESYFNYDKFYSIDSLSLINPWLCKLWNELISDELDVEVNNYFMIVNSVEYNQDYLIITPLPISITDWLESIDYFKTKSLKNALEYAFKVSF